MIELWYALLSLTLVLFAVLDGWNIGAGTVHLFVAKNDRERRDVMTALGPLWSWHEVWLIAAGGTLLLAFPGILATGFSGFYLALWFVLWALVLRGMAIEVAGHIDNDLWQSAWDVVFAGASVLLAVLFGAAFGNVIRGVPLDATGAFRMPLFTHFGVRGDVGILDWYTVSVAVFTTVLLAAHGATYLQLTAPGAVAARSGRLAARLWLAALAAFAAVSLETWVVRPDFYRGMLAQPLAWLAVAIVVAGAWSIGSGVRAGDARRGLLGSSAVIAGVLAAAAAAVFPVMLHSTKAPEHSLTAYGEATARHGLTLAIVWWPIAFVLAIGYAVIVVRKYGLSPASPAGGAPVAHD
jgi:cytochrome d ubiquinol oxidase subunit II